MLRALKKDLQTGMFGECHHSRLHLRLTFRRNPPALWVAVGLLQCMCSGCRLPSGRWPRSHACPG